MYMKEAIRVFGSRAAIVALLDGFRHRSAVYQWKEEALIPLGAAVLLARRSNGRLRVNDLLYEKERQKRVHKLIRKRELNRTLKMIDRAPRITK